MEHEYISDIKELNVRSKNVCLNNEIYTVYALSLYEESHIRRLPNAGRKTVSDLKATLESRGLSFQNKKREWGKDEVEEEEKEAYLYGGLNAHEYAQEIGKHDLASFTADEWTMFCHCMCKNYHMKYAELQNKSNFC